jgi:hypothetical protein
MAERDDLDYEIDGVVIKLDDLAARAAMGVTSHHPGALAFKFPPRQEITRIDKIDISVGRTGVLTPFAFLPGGGRRRHRVARDAAQPRGAQAEGPARRRHRAHPARG